MLDWNHILLREAFTPQQLADYWEKAGRPAAMPFAFGMQAPRQETQVEIAPRLLPDRVLPAALRSIACYEIEPARGEVERYQPEVKLARGMRLAVCKEEAAQIQGERYYPVVKCEPEPRAENLYLHSADVIETGAGEATRALVTRGDVVLYQLSSVDGKLRPLFEPGEVGLVGGTPVFVSTVHCLRPKDPGSGVVRSKSGQHFCLIVDCPRKPSAAGWFIRKKDLKQLRGERPKT